MLFKVPSTVDAHALQLDVLIRTLLTVLMIAVDFVVILPIMPIFIVLIVIPFLEHDWTVRVVTSHLRRNLPMAAIPEVAESGDRPCRYEPPSGRPKS
jgi:hypothetical protein